MGKDVLILLSSARKNGNSDRLAQAFSQGAEKAGNKVNSLRLSELNISDCLDCKGCWNSQGNCIVDDDMKKIEPLLESSSCLVIASPLYWSQIPGRVKNVIDRLYQYDPGYGGKKMAVKDLYILATASAEDDQDFRLLEDFFYIVASFNKIKLHSILKGKGLTDVDDIEGSTYLKEAYDLGFSI